MEPRVRGRGFAAASIIILLLSGLVFTGYRQVQQASAAPSFQRHPLVGAPPEEVGQYAIAYTRARYRVRSGTPQARLVRPVRAGDLPALGLPQIGIGEQTPLMLVILHGDFDLLGGPGMGGRPAPGTWHAQVEYLAYVFDLRAGTPVLTQTSHRGGILRQALNDPSLPDDLPPGQVPQGGRLATPKPALPLSRSGQPYGEVAPTVVPPTGR